MEKDLRYPIGKFRRPEAALTDDQRREVHRRNRTNARALDLRRKKSKARAARYALSSRRMDRTSTRASRSRQPHERLRAHETRAN